MSVTDCPLNCYIKPFSGNRRQFKTLSLLQTQFVNLSLNARPNNVNDSEKKATTRYGHSAGCRHFTSFSILIVHGHLEDIKLFCDICLRTDVNICSND